MEGVKRVFEGVATALVTPFSAGVPDEDALWRLTQRQVEAGVSAVVVCGTTGEAPTLTEEEYATAVSVAVSAAGGRTAVIAGVGGTDTRRVCRLCHIAAERGAEALLAGTPYYNRPGEEGLCRHFSLVADVGLPVILYNVPGRTGTDIPDSVYQRLCDREEVVGVKEASGNMLRSLYLCRRFGDRYAFYSGCDELNLPLLAAGYSGMISVTSNLVPDMLVRLWQLWREERCAEAMALDRELYPRTRELFLETNPIPVKKKLSLLGLCSDEVRLPLCPEAAEKDQGGT